MSRRRRSLWIFLSVVAVVIVSQYFRASNGVIAPELIRDVGLTPEMLGLVNGSFFVSLALAQIPVGMAFDRFGPRWTITALTALAVLGSIAFALATTPSGLLGARIAIGLGCAGSFMGAVTLAARWAPQDRFTQVLSWIFSLSNLGTLLATTPLAAGSESLGWRATFLIAAVGTALIGVMFAALVRDAPPEHGSQPDVPESLREVLRGVAEVWRTPGLGPVLAIHTVAYASLLTVQGLWAGAYLADVHGLDPLTRGNVLLAMAVATVCGVLCYGPMDRRFNTRKGVVTAGALATATILTALALTPQPNSAVAAALLIALGLVGHYGVVIVAHGRSLFPDRLIGRGVTTVNVAQSLGCAGLPILTGAVIGMFAAPDGPVPEAGYRAAFGCLALILVTGLLYYRRAPDSRPLAAKALEAGD